MNAADEREPNDIELLLPWHAAGTLSVREAQRVEAALAHDPELARRYEVVREELGQTIHLNETLGAPSPRTMQALFAKIDAEPPRRPTLSAASLGMRIGTFFSGLSPRALAWSASAAMLAILLQAGLIAGIVLKEKNATGYETASAPAAIGDEGSFALIRFQPLATAIDITKFLETNNLSIASGPSAGGLFRVRIGEAKLAKADRDRIVKALQEDKVVGFIAITE